MNHIHRKFAPAVAYGARLRQALSGEFVAPRPPLPRVAVGPATLGAVLSVPIVLALDLFAAPTWALFAFYLPPVAWISWRHGRLGGWALSLLTASAWYALERWLVGELGVMVGLWNALVHLLALSLVTEVSWRLANARAEAGELARTDSLTGVSNSKAFREAVADQIARCRRYGEQFAVAYLDVDHFKRLNDTLGHEVGDDVLRHVGGSLRANLRCIDSVARMGGDEFAVLLPQTDAARANSALEKWRRQLLRSAEANAWPVTVSIGIVGFEQPPEGVASVLRAADAVMYEVKHAGRNGIATSSAALEPRSQPPPAQPAAPVDSGTTTRRVRPPPKQQLAASERASVRPLKHRSRSQRRVAARKWLLTGKQV